MEQLIHVRLNFDGVRLFVTQPEIYVVEIIDDVQTEVEENEKAAGIMGWLAHGDEQYPVFTLSPNLDILMELPENRRYCTILQSEGTLFGLTCEDVISLPPGYNLRAQPIPEVMVTEDSPVDKLVVHDQQVGCLTTASRLMEYITSWGAEAYATV